jgi:hypothetical protein
VIEMAHECGELTRTVVENTRNKVEFAPNCLKLRASVSNAAQAIEIWRKGLKMHLSLLKQPQGHCECARVCVEILRVMLRIPCEGVDLINTIQCGLEIKGSVEMTS